VGFGLAFGAGGAFAFIGGSGFFPTFSPAQQWTCRRSHGAHSGRSEMVLRVRLLRRLLGIVWGTMLERTKFIVYILFGIPSQLSSIRSSATSSSRDI